MRNSQVGNKKQVKEIIEEENTESAKEMTLSPAAEYEMKLAEIRKAMLSIADEDQHQDALTFINVILEMYTTYLAKNKDYGSSSEECYKNFGILGTVVPLSHKYNRLVRLVTNGVENRKVKTESIQDTLLDLANYAVLGLTFIKKHGYRK